jgi:thiamine-phosphate pyrophosphorylase
MQPRVFVITDPAFAEADVCRQIERAAAGLKRGELGLQLRDKSRADDALRPYAERLRTLTSALGVPFVVNGRPALARSVGADGVHLGSDACSVEEARRVAGGGAWISVACHRESDVDAALVAGADAVLVSPIFDTPSGGKRGRGLEAVRVARRIVDASRRSLLVYALGGISPRNARDCFDAGADGVACIRAVLEADDAADAARALCAWHPRSRGATLQGPMTTYEESLAITKELLRRHVEIDRDIRPNDHIQNDLGLDSLGVMELVADVETRFDVAIPSEMFDSIATVDDVARAVVRLKLSGATA